MDLCHALHQDNGLFSMDESLVREMLYRAFDRKGSVIGVIDGDSEIAGAIYMLLSHYWYTTQTHLEELFNFVRPGYRKSGYADELLEFSKECQRKIGVPLIVGIVSNHRTEAKVRLYSRQFGTPAGAFFVVGGQWIRDTEPVDYHNWMHDHDRGDNRRRRGNTIMALRSATMTTAPSIPMGGG